MTPSTAADRRGDALPEWAKDKQARLARLRAAKAALEAEASAPPPPDAEPGPSTGMRPRRDGGPPARAHRNFSDPDSRIMKTRDGFIQGYNGQIAVDAGHHRLAPDQPRPRLAARRASSRPTPASAASTTWPCWRRAASPAVWRPAGALTATPTRAAAGGSRPAA